MLEALDNLWVWLLSAVGGVSIGTILAFIIKITLTRSFTKHTVKATKELQRANEEFETKRLEKIKKVAFTQNIQPVLESGLEKVSEKSQALIKAEIGEIKENQAKIVNILEKLGAYFDNSIISEEKKAEFKEAIELSKTTQILTETAVVEQVTEPTQENEPTPQIAQKNAISVER